MKSAMRCWEICRCNKKDSCLFGSDKKKACWEMARENDSTLFHICVDCLVYRAQQGDSRLTAEEFSFIMEQRQQKIHMVYEPSPARPPLRPAPRTRKPPKRHLPHSREGATV